MSNVVPFPGFLHSQKSYKPFPLPQSTIPHFPIPVFLYTTTSSLSRTKSLSSLWCLTKPSSAAYVPGATGNSLCTLWLMVLSLGALGVLGDSYCCSSYGAANPFSSLGPFSSSSIGDRVLSSLIRLLEKVKISAQISREPKFQHK